MSEMDKFVLQYAVEMKDAISRLEQLNGKVTDVNKNAHKAKGEFAEFSKGAVDELGKVVPGVDKVSAAVKMMGAEFAVASLAVGALALGIKATMDMRAQYGQQRLDGLETGVSALRMEEYQRKFAKGSNGTVDRATAASEIKAFSQKIVAAYTDPSRMGTENRQLKLLGIDPGERGKGMIPFNTAITKLAEQFSKMKPEQVQGVAKSIGMNQDFASTLAKLGGKVGTVTEMTADEISKRNDAQDSLTRYNAALAKLGEKFTELENALGEKFIPKLTAFVEWLIKVSDKIPEVAKPVIETYDKYVPDGSKVAKEAISKDNPLGMFNPLGALYNAIFKSDKAADDDKAKEDKVSPPPAVDRNTVVQTDLPQKKLEWPGVTPFKAPPVILPKVGEQESKQSLLSKAISLLTPGGFLKPSPDKLPAALKQESISKPVPDSARKINDKEAPDNGKDKVTSKADNMMEMADKAFETQKATASDMSLAVNMFAGAVSAFANTIDERQAWASWAGEIGRASGLGSGANTPDVAVTAPEGLPANFDHLFEKYGKQEGVSPDLLKRVANVESKFNPNAESEVGAKGLMQIMDSNKKNLGITNSFDPEQNIRGGPKLLAENIKAAGGNIREALLMYHGGTDRSNWGKRTLAYPGKVLGDGAPTARGESRDKMQLLSVQANIANRLHVPLAQLQQGGINRGDVAWANSQLKSGISNNIFDLQKQLMNAGLTQQGRAKIITDIRDQQSGLNMMSKYGSQVENKAQEGDRVITIGERAVMINVSGAGNPQDVAENVQKVLGGHIGDIVNLASDGFKY